MAFQPVFQTARVELIYNIFQQTCENVIYVQNEADWTDVTLESLAETVAGWWGSEMSSNISDSCTLAMVRCTDLGEENSWQVEFNPTSANVGQRTSPALPLNVTLAIKFSSGLTGRSQRGRAYMVGLTEDQVVGNEMVAARTAEIVGAWGLLNNELHTASPFWQHSIVSYVTNGAPRTNGRPLDVVAYSSDGFIDSQRRRLSGRGS